MRKSRTPKALLKAGLVAASATAATLALAGPAQAANVSGSSTNGCAIATGIYNYTYTGTAQGRDLYDAYFNIAVRDQCAGDGWAAALHLSYWKYDGGAWRWTSMQRVRTNGTYNTTVRNVDGLQINVCNYYPERAPAGCSRVW